MNKNVKLFTGVGAFVLLSVAAKVLGLFFRVPLFNILSPKGVGLYQLAFPLYAVLLTVSSSAFPVVLSRKIASLEQGEGERYASSALVFGTGFAVILATLTAVFSPFIARLLGNGDAAGLFVVISPAIVFVSVLSAGRGYFQGKRNFLPSGVSLILEQGVKLVFGLIGALIGVKISVNAGAIGAVAGVTASELVAAVYMAIRFFSSVKGKFSVSIKAFFSLVPSLFNASLGSLVLPLTMLVDSAMTINIISRAVGVEVATREYGILSAVSSVINMPSVVVAAVGAYLVPSVASKRKSAEVSSAFKFACVFGFSAAFVLFFFPSFVLRLLFPSLISGDLSLSSSLLRLGAINVLLTALVQTTTAYLHGAGKFFLPALNLFIAGAAKVGASFVLLTRAGIYGAMASSVVCYSVALPLDVGVAVKNGLDFKFLPIVKTAAALVLFGSVAGALGTVFPSFWGFVIAVIIAGAVAVGYCAAFSVLPIARLVQSIKKKL